MKDQFFTDYLDRLEALRDNLRREIQDLNQEAMDWLPGTRMNSMAVLMAHITGVVREGIDLSLGGPSGRIREQEFQTHSMSGTVMLRGLDDVIEYARNALPRLDLEELRNEREDEDGTFTCGWVLLHALDHAYLHLGHLQITCQMWKQGEMSRR